MQGEIDLRCYTLGANCDDAVETHWRIQRRTLSAETWPVCANHIWMSRDLDADSLIVNSFTVLYLPIVQPVVGSEQAIAMEVALHAACRLLRICKGDDEAEQTLALLRQTQAEARARRRTRRVLGLEAGGDVRPVISWADGGEG